MHLPYLTANLPGVGGAIRRRPSDFFVQEIPQYLPSGQGEHLYVEIEKTDLTTFSAINALARALDVPSRDIGYAGLKDAHAVARQTLSIPRVDPQRVLALNLPNLAIRSAILHTNKLRPGHLAGNRFAIAIRDVNPTDVLKLPAMLALIDRRGLPNYFGAQRFGRRGDNAILGAHFVRGDDDALLRQLLGNPDPAVDPPDAVTARQAFDRGDHDAAMRLYPRGHGLERTVLARFTKTRDPRAAVAAVDQKIRRLWISALQSEAFNAVVAARIDTLDHLLDGDFAMKHDSGGCFPVTDPAAEQPRCDRFEISPTGPMIGYRMNSPQGPAGALERDILDARGLREEHFRESGRLRIPGQRRPLRVRPADVTFAGGADDFGPFITIAFTLPPGSFATTLLRELMKTPDATDADDAASNESD